MRGSPPLGNPSGKGPNKLVATTYTNVKGQTYVLHHGRSKTGKPTYYFSLTREGQVADSIPDGFEIYENPNAQVFLRRIPPKHITDAERQVVVDGMRTYASGEAYKIDVKGTAIIIYLADQDKDAFDRIFRDYPTSPAEKMRIMTMLRQQAHYSPMMQFILVDEQQRRFWPQRYCFRGSIDDWISIGQLDTLANVVTSTIGIPNEKCHGMVGCGRASYGQTSAID